MKEGYDAIDTAKKNIGKDENGWLVGNIIGDRKFINNDWLKRAAASLAGIYGNSAEEAIYPMAKHDNTGAELDGSKHNYTVTFACRSASSRECLLVGHNVRRQNATAHRKPHQPLPHQFANATRHEEESRRFRDDLHPERCTLGRQESQLAARAQRPHLHGHASLLAKETPPSILPAGEGTWKPPAIVVTQ